VRIDTLRSVLSAFSYRKIEAGRELDDSEQLDVVRKQVKQRNDSIEGFRKGKRDDLVAKEERERELLSALLPPQKSEDELRPIVRAGLAELPEGQRNQGAAMKLLMPRLKDQADGNTIRRLVVEELEASS
jgi:uncharacterized protein YqeY